MPKVAGAARRMATVCAVVSVMGWVMIWTPRAEAQDLPAGFPERVTEAPAVPPVGCPAAMLDGLRAATGTAGYRSLHREIASLKLGHSASQEVQTALSRHGKAGEAAHEIVLVMSGLADAQNTYLCASFVAGLGAADEKGERSQAQALISVYNRMALHAWQLANVLSTEAARAQRSGSAAADDGGSGIAAIMQDRKRAGSDLLDVMTAGALQVVDRDGASPGTPDRLRMTCGERDRLVSEVAPLAKSAAVDEFTIAAGLVQDFLKKPYRCAA